MSLPCIRLGCHILSCLSWSIHSFHFCLTPPSAAMHSFFLFPFNLKADPHHLPLPSQTASFNVTVHWELPSVFLVQIHEINWLTQLILSTLKASHERKTSLWIGHSRVRCLFLVQPNMARVGAGHMVRSLAFEGRLLQEEAGVGRHRLTSTLLGRTWWKEETREEESLWSDGIICWMFVFLTLLSLPPQSSQPSGATRH